MYTKSRKVKIMLRESGSSFLTVNRAHINRKNKIGGSITTPTILMQKDDMIKAIMPSVINVSSNHTEFQTRVQLYFDSISKSVDETGLILETGFIYTSEKEYQKFMERFNEIEDTYDAKVKTHSTDMKYEADAFKDKYETMREHEGTHYNYGKPINPSDWILYYYCLYYGDVANRQENVEASNRIRFYIYDEKLMERNKIRIVDIATQAEKQYFKIYENIDTIENILIAAKKIDVLRIEEISDVDKLMTLREFREKQPLEFVRITTDKKLVQKAFVNKCITLGFLRQLPHTDVIVTGDGENKILGNNVDEVIVKLEKDVPTRTALENQVKSKLSKVETE